MAACTLLCCLFASLVALSSAARDSQGTEFILGYMENTQWRSDALNDIELFITTVSNTPATVTVTTPKFNPGWSDTITVTRGNIKMVKVPHAIRGVGVEKSNKGVRVVSTQEVSVYSVNKEPKSTDAYISLPLDVLGTEYYALTYTVDAELVIVGTQDNTAVTIKWPTDAGNVNFAFGGTTYRNGDTQTLTLDKYDTYHVLQASNDADFTGAYITSNNPIAVISGNKKIAVPVNSGSKDHLTEMLMPVDTWGKTFMTSSTPDRSIGDIFRIVASEDSTTVTVSNGQSYSITKAGKYKDIDLATSDYNTITTNKPVMVAMFAKTWKNDGPHYGDPAMSLIIPEPQYAADYTWSSVKDPTGADFNNKIAVIIEKSQKSGLRLDGSTISWNQEKDIAGSTKIHLWMRVTPGSHNIYHTDPAVTFMALASGTFLVNSYAYAAGLRLAQINAVCVPTPVVAGDILDNDCDGTIDEETLNGIDDDGDGVIDEDLAIPPRIDGQWGGWGSYGSCSVSCNGAGVKTKTRPCNNPAPANNGLDCVGVGSETATCNNGACPVNGAWSGWGSYGTCTVTCGGGSKTRTRSCQGQANGGLPCPGASSDTASCNTGGCPVNGAWSGWGSYGTCTVTCGGGSKTRTRSCQGQANGGLPCSGASSDTASCNTGGCPVNGAWSGWGSYGTCTVTCGGGSKTRTRSCQGQANGGLPCSGASSDTASCNTGGCPVNGAWSGWGSYGTCTVTCGGGSKTRTRSCQGQANGGLPCSGASSDTASCNTQSCSSCSGSAQSDVVFILDASGSVGSSNFETMKTFVRDLVDAFDIGANQIRVGVQKYSRDSNTEFNLNDSYDKNAMKTAIMNIVYTGGNTNTGGALSYVRTSMFTSANGDRAGVSNIAVVLTDGRSNDYTDTVNQANTAKAAGITIFSIGIGSGIPLGELNAISTDPDSEFTFAVSGFSGLTGIMDAFQAKACVPPSPVNGALGTWAGWGACSVTCAGGSQTRTRACDNPVPLYGGAACTGATTESQSCNTHVCPVHGAWGGWGGWGTCSVTCGGGSKSRTRSCDSPAPMHAGNPCAGLGTESATCNTTPCPVDGALTAWTSWGACSTTCAAGSWSRGRTCTSPAPAHGGAPCTGVTSQTDVCNLGPCPVDGAWGSWQAYSACSVTCMGIGVKGRTRNCDSPAAAHGGATCPGAGDETAVCDKSLTLCSPGNGWAVSVYSTTPGAPVDGGWDTWAQWTTCTKTCGAGMRLRQRRCNSPVPQFGGLMCQGDILQKEICGNTACPRGSGYVQTCPERFFDCKNGNVTCVHFLKKCDCTPDCDDASDEDQEWGGCIASNAVCQNAAHGLAPVSLLTLLLVAAAASIPALCAPRAHLNV